jgi:hypothetical protein
MATKAESLVLDSRKFLGTINNSAQSKVAMYESLVTKLGQRVGAKWRLAALNEGNLFIEDTNSGAYYAADHQHLRGGKVNITNIRPVKIVESQKQSLFEQDCHGLVNAIEANDQRAMRTTFNNLAAHKFSPHTIPPSGIIRTRDGVVRRLQVESHTQNLSSAHKQKLVKALVESLSDSVVLESGRVISASFNSERRQKLPVSEWTCRKVVGTHMRESAKQAYKSDGFQKRIYKIAQLVDGDKISEAVTGIKDFLAEQQEFCLLTRRECQTLVENTLAARAVMNQQLCNDVATLFYRTNLKVNRDTIVKEWRATAVKSQHPTLLENVTVLEKSKDFDGDYDKFLNMTFNEALSPRDEEVKAYRTALGLLRDSPKIQEDVELQEKVNELIDKLSESEVDDATVYLVRETLASAHKELEAMDTLNDYDTQGGSETNAGIDAGEELGDEIGDDLGAVGGGAGQPNIVINSPLIQIGGTSSAAEGGEPAGDELADLGDEGLGDEGLGDEGLGDEGEEDDLDELGLGDDEDEEDDLGLGDEEDEMGGLNLDSKQKTATPVSERVTRKALGMSEDKDWLKDKIAEREGKKDDDKDDDKDDSKDDESEEVDECDDPYAMGESVDFTSNMGVDYGRSILRDEMNDVVSNMFKLAESKDVDLEDIDTHKLAMEAIVASGLRIPEHRINATVDNIVEQFNQIAEDQYKNGTLMRRRNPRRSSLGKTERKKPSGNSVSELGDGAPPEADAGIDGEGPKNESRIRRNIVWLEHDESGKGMKGDLDGVRFILDYADPFVILSEDGNVNVPIPESLFESALCAAGLRNGDSKPFSKWLAQGIEQFRPITEEEDNALQEAVATITAGSDGSVSVSVDTGVEGGEGGEESQIDIVGVGGEIGDEAGEFGDEGNEVGGEFGGAGEPNEMQPVTDQGIEPEAEGPEAVADEMPNFEADNTPEPEEPEEEIEGEEKIVEDKDITDPKKSDYDTTKQDHRDLPKEKGAQKPKGKGKELEGFDSNGKVDVSVKDAAGLKPVKAGENRI